MYFLIELTWIVEALISFPNLLEKDINQKKKRYKFEIEIWASCLLFETHR